VPRLDIPPKVVGEYRYVGDLSVPGMLHARVVRPPEAGAKVISLDENQKLPGLVRVVRRGDFVAVVCEREEQAIRAARQLKVTWQEQDALPAMSDLHGFMRSQPTGDKVVVNKGDVAPARAASTSPLFTTTLSSVG